MSNQVANIKKPSSLMATMAEKYGVPEKEMLETLKATAFRQKSGEVTNAQMTALLIVANQYNLNPWTKEIYAFPHNGGIVPIVGVDGWARIINENPMFDGMEFLQDDEKTTCIMYRKDRSHSISVTEYYEECKRPTDAWKMKKRMMRHKSMIQCARVTFAYTGIYDEDEAERIVGVKDMGNAQVVSEPKEPKEPAMYPAAEFDKNLEKWHKAIDDKKKTADDIIAMIESKGKLTDEQKGKIRRDKKEPVKVEGFELPDIDSPVTIDESTGEIVQ